MNQNKFFDLMLLLAGALDNSELSDKQRIYIVKLMACNSAQEITKVLQEYDIEFPMYLDNEVVIR